MPVLMERSAGRTVCEGNLWNGRVVTRMERGRDHLGGQGRGRANCRLTVVTWEGILQQEQLTCHTGLEQEEP